MIISFPGRVELTNTVPQLQGLRLSPFVNIDGEAFGQPTLNGFWRLSMTAVGLCREAQMALSAFVTAMSAANAECVVPVAVQWGPNDSTGRPLGDLNKTSPEVPLWSFDHVGFLGAPFDGFTLRAAASHRDSYIDIDKPRLSQLWPGMFISLGDRLHQVVNTTSIGESETAIRVSIMPNVREAVPAGEIVVVDQLRLRCRLESGDPVGASVDVIKSSNLTFIEAF